MHHKDDYRKNFKTIGIKLSENFLQIKDTKQENKNKVFKEIKGKKLPQIMNLFAITITLIMIHGKGIR